MVLRNVRPDRQTALFSATFPRAVEQLARKALQHPLEIVCGGKSVASDTVDQYVEVRPEQTKFMRLLQLLGVWFERGSTLVFVDTQLKCDSIYEQLVKAGYPSLSLHGGKEQDDRASTIKDFQDGVATVLVATSVAGRGLDVPAISCVVNYSCPNHLEDYVHRVGRTGRAGRKGTAYTFLDPSTEDAYAPILKKALTQAKRTVPPELDQLAKKFVDKTKTGEKKWAPSGFAGRGFKFDDDELDEEKQRAKAQRKLMESEMGLVVAESHLDDEEGPEKEAPAPAPAKEPDVPALAPDQLATNLAASAGAALPNAVTRAPQAAQAAVAGVVPQLAANVSDLSHLSPVERAKALAARFGRVPIMAARQAAPAASPHDAALARARALAAGMTGAAPQSTAPVLTPAQLSGETAYDELDINDYPGEARLRATNRDVLLRVQEETGAALINRGVFVAPGTQPPPGQRRLYLAIEGQDARAVALAKAEMKRVLNEETLNLAAGGSRSQSAMANYGKYSLV